MTTTTHRRLHPGLLALAMGGFGIGLTEFSITGLLSDVANDLGVSIPVAGGLVTGYALGVVIGAFTVTLALVSRPPKTALLILLALFVAGNALSAAGPTYELVMAGRILAALCHGGFFGIGAVLAARLVTPDRQASAIALMFAGLTVANVLGVPAGTALGHRFGWRATFVAVAVIGLVAMTAIAALVPTVPAETTSVRTQLSVLVRPSVWIACGVTALVFGGLFGAFTYIEPLLRSVTGFGAAAIPWLLVLFGLGLFAGNLVGGRAADRDADRALLVFASLLPLGIAAVALVAGSKPLVAGALAVMGLIGFATVPSLQLRVLRNAGTATLIASSANIAAFNLGNAAGAQLGGMGISAGGGATSPVWIGVALSAAGALLAAASISGERRRGGQRARLD
ncbi:Major facilitator superfamily MFS_1 OS=Tsukamurella paurometabola (strain ATCC 8368 / DSM /CCUG 35730 / CIP 100753 / JCM 10117 / KCTC 9821 / NBRC 16120/ NCIMB 702349 / NCTC 13040) OX=521096 GN=Tpau_2186 PE=4 SV=1 [Tsukamurella paurometabola]|uniref:Major facilitator superfamily MFS_1 n=1 Tax=Tsukamurella paurometabola (strain ATCC 8368 / DSM 20162 / CCUG 35730 / CIP 100753 / JCM 10117 / KCTC 9821 / NBRC 16120 / NCIMB 702349 / NCTC 13040) TaxID=521096 RepID=D5UPN9_TSUPD|nr:MFS transporter [Tsukamurella paurometabola]ADG78795.1 major facilitator superfamily MFS_1 [Tsukamurella paurometabola DSM 20162]SUP33174.1 Inner membrane transport protein ydhP [Tsukamurella paurometabola]